MGRGNKDFKKGGKLDEGVGALTRTPPLPPPRNPLKSYDLRP